MPPYRMIDKRAKFWKEGKIFDNNATAIDGLIIPLRYIEYETAKKKIDTYYRVMFVRNPLERILSAWKDRLVGKVDSDFQIIDQDIIKKIRTDRRNRTKYPTLLEFFTFLHSQRQRAATMNPHWKPINKLCHVCAIKYDFIGKLESITSDVKLLLDTIKPEMSLKIKVPTMRDPIPKDQDDRYIELRKSVPLHLTRQVLEIYKDDYNLFGYNMTKDIEEAYYTE